MRQQRMTITKNGLVVGYISPVTDLPTSQEQFIPVDNGGGGGTTYVPIPKTLPLPVEAPIKDGTTLPVPAPNGLPVNKDGTTYYAEGSISDANGLLLSVLVTVTLKDGTIISGPDKVTSGYYGVSTMLDPNTVYVWFAPDNYEVLSFTLAQLMKSGNVVFGKEHAKIPTWAILLVIAAVALSAKSRGKAVGFALGDIPWFVWATGGILAFSIIQKILIKIGLWDSQATKDLDAAQNNPNSFWSPNYWQTIKPANAQWSFALTTGQATTMCKTIYDSFGAFNDDEDTVIGVFKQCQTKANCSFLSYVWQQLYGSDLLTYIRGGLWPSDRLSDADVNTINQYISRLPNY